MSLEDISSWVTSSDKEYFLQFTNCLGQHNGSDELLSLFFEDDIYNPLICSFSQLVQFNHVYCDNL